MLSTVAFAETSKRHRQAPRCHRKETSMYILTKGRVRVESDQERRNGWRKTSIASVARGEWMLTANAAAYIATWCHMCGGDEMISTLTLRNEIGELSVKHGITNHFPKTLIQDLGISKAFQKWSDDLHVASIHPRVTWHVGRFASAFHQPTWSTSTFWGGSPYGLQVEEMELRLAEDGRSLVVPYFGDRVPWHQLGRRCLQTQRNMLAIVNTCQRDHQLPSKCSCAGWWFDSIISIVAHDYRVEVKQTSPGYKRMKVSRQRWQLLLDFAPWGSFWAWLQQWQEKGSEFLEKSRCCVIATWTPVLVL